MIRRVIGSAGIIAIVGIIGCSPAGRHFAALENSDVKVRREAIYELNKERSIQQKHAEKLLVAARDNDPVVREYAFKAIAKLPPRTKGVSRGIRLGLRDSNITVRRTAAAVFSYMNPVPSEILIPLAEMLGDKDSILYSYVKSTFLDLGPLGVNALVHSCKSENQELRCRAATTLGHIGCDAKRALPVLQEMLNDTNDLVRDVAKSSIDKIQYSYVCGGQRRSQ